MAPGHGDLISAPHDEIRYLIAHRLKREQKVVDALSAAGPCPIDSLLPIVYDDVAVSLHKMAEKSLHAHLLKLKTDGRAVTQGQDWVLL
jgi:hypothetical protein